jgi:hypothetical protein
MSAVVHHSKTQPSMSALGQKRTLQCILVMSALPPKADMAELELPFNLPASHRCALDHPGCSVPAELEIAPAATPDSARDHPLGAKVPGGCTSAY